MTKPTVFGSNGNSLMAGGEAGNEAVLPLNGTNLGSYRSWNRSNMGGLSPVINVSISGNNIVKRWISTVLLTLSLKKLRMSYSGKHNLEEESYDQT